MAFIDNRSAQEKRDLARRARRLAQTQLLDADRIRLMEFAVELEKAADALERPSSAIAPPQARQPSAEVSNTPTASG